MSLFKSAKIYRESIIQLRFEFFNVLNHTQFNVPNGRLGSGFGQITSTRAPRIIQLGGRIQWYMVKELEHVSWMIIWNTLRSAVDVIRLELFKGASCH